MTSKIKRKGKKIPVGDNNNHDDKKPGPVVVYHEFWKKAPADLLMEIFIRLPHSGLAVRCSSVCRLWHSLIINNPEFIPRFMSQHRQHQDRYPPLSSYTIIFHTIHRSYINGMISPDRIYNYGQIFSKEWTFLRGKLSKTNFWDFMPHPTIYMRASCNDLLLVSSPDSGHGSKNDFYVCNPITKQFVHLPAIPQSMDSFLYRPWSGGFCYGLLSVPTTTNFGFKVVQVILPDDSFPLSVIVFCSESRKWEKRNFHYPSKISYDYQSIHFVTCNGILYLLGGSKNVSDIFYLDLLKEECGVIDFPPSSSLHCRHRIGVVCVPGGELELRLIQVINNPRKACAHLNVWRLGYNKDGDTNWFSVHNKDLTNMISKQQNSICQPVLHPTNPYLVFLFWDQSCFQFNLTSRKYKKMDEIAMPTEVLTDSIVPFPMVISYTSSCLT